MPEVTVDLRTLDLTHADQQPVTGKHVRNLQAVLNVFLSMKGDPSDPPGLPQLVIDGVAGPKTKDALLQFQRVAAASEDTVVGPTTWKRLIELPIPT